MSFFVFDGILECGKHYELGKREARHILKSRRLKPGEHILIQDSMGQRFDATLEKCDRKQLTFVTEFSVAVPPSSTLRLEILQAITKEKSLDWILQKSTELGVNRLDFFYGKNSPNHFRNLNQKHQLSRWNRISLEATKQCGRQFPPEIFWHPNLETALKTKSTCKNSWVLSPTTENSVSWESIKNARKNIKKHHRILVGPEGGFHKDEIDLSFQSGFHPVNLGPRILRSETAAVAASSILQFLLGDL